MEGGAGIQAALVLPKGTVTAAASFPLDAAALGGGVCVQKECFGCSSAPMQCFLGSVLLYTFPGRMHFQSDMAGEMKVGGERAELCPWDVRK